MRSKKLWLLCAAAIVLIWLGYIYSDQHKSTENVDNRVIQRMSFTILAKKCDGFVEYFFSENPTQPYDCFYNAEFERTEAAVLGSWQYKMILTDTLTAAEDGAYLVPNDGKVCVLEMYQNYITVDGITYSLPEYEYICQMVSDYYESNVGNYPTYVSYE